MPSAQAETASDHVTATLQRLEQLWGIPGLTQRATVRFSGRLTRSFGTCRVATGEITLAQRLTRFPDTLHEVLVHEAAHLAVYLAHGRAARQHGDEWKALMRAAAVEPRRCLPPLPGDPPPRRRRPQYYLHACRWCDSQRVGRRPVRTWGCIPCHEAGRTDTIVITRLAS